MKIFPVYLIGIVIGIIVTADPFISAYLSKMFDLEILDIGLFEINTFQFTSLIILISSAVFIGSRKFSSLFKYIFEKKEIFLIALIVASPQFKALSLGFFDIIDIPILFLIFIWLVEASNEKKIILNTPLHFLLYLFIILFLLSSVHGGMTGLIMLIRISKSIFYAFILITLLRNKNDLMWGFKVLFITLLISSVIGIIQEIIFLGTGMTIIGNVSEEAREMMIQNSSFGIVLRVPAFFGNHAVFARTLAFTIPILFSFLLVPEMKNYFNRKIYTLYLFLMLVALVLTFSRPNYIAVFIGLIICLYLIRPSYLIHFVTAIALLIIIAHITGITTEIQQAVYEEKNLGGDFHDRLALATESVSKLSRHPLIGTGLAKASRYTANVHNWPVHNGFILAFVTAGIVGFTIFCLGFIYIISSLIAIFREKDLIFKTLGLGMLGAMCSYLFAIQFTTGFFDYVYCIYVIALNASIIYLWSESKINRFYVTP